MDPFVHCIHYYNAVIHFIRHNVKKFYQMHFLFFRKEWSIQTSCNNIVIVLHFLMN